MIENQIPGNQQEGQFELTTPQCNHPEHKGKFVSYVCLKVGCIETRGYCMKCNLKQHHDCKGHIQLYEDIIKEIQTLQEKNNKILQIFKSTLDKQIKLHKQVQSRCEIFKRFIEEQSSKNLNNLAEILPSYFQYDLNKLLQGQEQLQNIFQSHFVQNFIQNIDDSHDMNEINQQQNQDKELSQIKKIRIISDIQNENNENKKEDQRSSVNQFEGGGQINIEKQKQQKQHKQQKEQNEQEKLQKNIIKPPTYKLNSPQRGSEDAQQCHMKGQFHYKKKQYAEAIEYFDLAIVLNPDNPSTWNNKGTALSKLDRDFESIKCFDRALEIINSRPQIDQQAKLTFLGNKVSALVALKQYEQLIEILDEGLAMDPKNKRFFKLKVMTLLKTKQLTEALKTVDEAIQQDPRNYKVLQLKGLILFKLQKIDEAIENLRQSCSINPKKSTYLILGKVLVQVCEFREAQLCYQRAIELDPNYYEAIQELEMVSQYIKFE